jgi:hypothetical protein
MIPMEPITGHLQRNIQTAADQAAAGEPREVFCLSWPIARVSLLALQQLAPTIPTVGWMVTLGVSIVLSTGDAAHQALRCTTLPQ